MNVLPILTAAILATMVVATVARASPPEDPLQRYRGQARVLVAIAETAQDPRLVQQRHLFAAMGHGAAERDLVLLQGVGDAPQAVALRRLFNIESGFRAVLVGKDGTEKLNTATPVGPDRLFPLIDSMPMRQDEMRQDEMRQRP